MSLDELLDRYHGAADAFSRGDPGYASSQMSDGQVVGFDEIARYTSRELATILEVEHWRARVGDRDSVEPFDLRVTTTFRHESGEWKIVHRHADPISTEDDSGPLRTS